MFSSIYVVPIVTTKAPVFPGAKVLASLPSVSISRKPPPIYEVTVFATRAPVSIMKIAPI